MKICKIKRKRFPSLPWLLAYRPSCLLLSPRLLLARSAFPEPWSARDRFPAPLWAEPPSAQIARERHVPLSSLHFTDIAGPHVRAASLLKPSATTPSKNHRRRIRLPISTFLTWSAFGLYKPSLHTPLLPSRPLEAIVALVSTATASISPTRRH
jgi:hypothetical protein